MKEVGTIAIFKIKISIFVFLALVGLVLATLFVCNPGIRSQLSFIAASIGGLAITYSAYHVALAHKLNIQRDKIHQSFEFAKQLNCIDLARIRVFLESEVTADGHTLSPKDFHDKIIGNHEIYTSVKSLLGLFEDLSIAIQIRYIDEGVAHKSLNYLVNWSYNNFRPYIEQRRQECRHDNLFIELEKLANSWKGKKMLSTGQLF